MNLDLLYFAYGSNLRSVQMNRLCPGCRFLSSARLAGYRLAFTLPDEEWEGGVADLLPASGHEVWGALYGISAAHLASLDAYELCHPGEDPARSAYLRRTVEVSDAAGRSIGNAWCYFVREPRGHIPPSGLYRQALLEGARERGLPPAYLDIMRSAFGGPDAQASLACAPSQ
jgi:gamma-glutamylcyclotransferase (GGCT)/AIG2-like uncharacterized protein YtfP